MEISFENLPGLAVEWLPLLFLFLIVFLIWRTLALMQRANATEAEQHDAPGPSGVAPRAHCPGCTSAMTAGKAAGLAVYSTKTPMWSRSGKLPRALVCGHCGYIELYAPNPDAFR